MDRLNAHAAGSKLINTEEGDRKQKRFMDTALCAVPNCFSLIDLSDSLDSVVFVTRKQLNQAFTGIPAF